MTATVIEMGMALVESRTLRSRHATRTDVLDKVKALALLPDDIHATKEIVADYYEVPVSTLGSLVAANLDELEANGYRTIRGAGLREFVSLNPGLANLVSPKTRQLALFDRRTILNVGQLLRESEVARQVRDYLLNLDSAASPEVRAAALVPYREQVEVLAIIHRVIPVFAEAKLKIVAARMLGEVPEIDPADMPLYAAVFLEEKGLKRRVIDRFESKFGLRCSNRYLKEYGVRPAKVAGPATSAHIKKINVYKQSDRPLLEEVYLGMAAEFAAFEQGAAA